MALVFVDRYQPREESAEALQRLFDVCFDSADAFSLSRAAWARQDHTLERALEPYVLRRLRTMRGVCYYTANSNPQRIALYPLNEQTKSILRAQYRGLFLEDWSGRLPRWVPSMEDLCFFRNGTLLLGTVSRIRKTASLRSAFRTPSAAGEKRTIWSRSISCCRRLRATPRNCVFALRRIFSANSAV